MTGVATVITTTITIVTRFKFAFDCAKGRQGSGGPSFLQCFRGKFSKFELGFKAGKKGF